MTTDDFTRIHRESGFQIQKIDGRTFLRSGLVSYSFPLLLPCQIDLKLVNKLKWRALITVIKTQSTVKNACEYILKTKDYPVEAFPHRTRTTVRKSLKSCEFRRPSLSELKTEGLQINRQTLKIQGRKDKFLTTSKRWNRYATLLYSNSDALILGAFADNKMVAFAIAYELEQKHYFHIQHIDRDYGTYYPMSGLMYSIINQILTDKESIEISDGIESLTPLPTLNKFKRCMRFERTPITRIYILHPAVAIVLKSIIFFYIRVLKKRNFRKKHLRQITEIYHGYRLTRRLIERMEQSSLRPNYILQSHSSQ